METGKIGITALLLIFFSFSFQFAFGSNHCAYWQVPVDDGGCDPVWWVSQDIWLVVGVGTAAIGVGIAAVVTVFDRKSEIKKRTQELIQLYDEELRTIINEEKSLSTKLDCVLYVERFLDTLEKIASLSSDKNFGKAVSDFFENNFSYGIDLWRWYQINVIKIRGDLIGVSLITGPLWELPIKNPREKNTLSNISDEEYNVFLDTYKEFKENDFVKKYLEKNKLPEINESELKKSINEFLGNERWSEFRFWCRTQTPEISPLQSDFGKILKDVPEDEKYQILPDSLNESYDLLPEENGLTKGEFVEIIRGYGNDLGKLTEKERNLKTQVDCAIYAEQYLDTLEQLASLYEKDILPKKAADYFENKFCYGMNLWNWYEKFVDTKKSKKDPTKYEQKTPDDIIKEWKKRDEKNDRWLAFKWWCDGGKDPDQKLSEFYDDDITIDTDIAGNEIQVGKVLPEAMYYYDHLPPEEGLDASTLMEIIQDYGKQLNKLMEKEQNLRTQIDCSVYAEQYLDTLDQIAYLFNVKALATDAPTYFENNFAYGKTLMNWYQKRILEKEGQDSEKRWSEFDKYFTNYRDKEDGSELTAFQETKLPEAMRTKYDDLHEDLVALEKAKKNNNSEKPTKSQ